MLVNSQFDRRLEVFRDDRPRAVLQVVEREGFRAASGSQEEIDGATRSGHIHFPARLSTRGMPYFRGYF